MRLTKKAARILGIILGTVLFSLLTAGITYAWYTWTSSNIDITGSSACFTIDYTKGPNISGESIILFDESEIISNNKITVKNGMGITAVTAGIKSTCTVPGIVTVTLNINELNSAYISGESAGAFKYVLASYDPSIYPTISTAILSGESFDIILQGSITSGDPITLLNENLSNTIKGYLVIFYVDGNLAQNNAQNSEFSAIIEAIATQTGS